MTSLRENSATPVEIPMDDQSVVFETARLVLESVKEHSSTSPTRDTSVRPSGRMLNPPASLQGCSVTKANRFLRSGGHTDLRGR